VQPRISDILHCSLYYAPVLTYTCQVVCPLKYYNWSNWGRPCTPKYVEDKKNRVVTYRHSFCARCWLCWHTLHSITYRMCSDFSIPIGSTVLSRMHSIRRAYQPNNSNFNLLLDLNTELKPHQNRNNSRMPITVGMMCTYSVATLTVQRVVWKDTKFLCFEGWISVRLQASYVSCPLSPCQHKTWPYTLPPCWRSQSLAAKHPTYRDRHLK
jgi:hypothetical protein